MGEFALAPSRPRTGGGMPSSVPATPASGNRRKRQAVGFTNRSRPSTALTQSRADEWNQQDARPRTSNGERPKMSSSHGDRPRTSDSSRRPSIQGQTQGEARNAKDHLFTQSTGFSGAKSTGFSRGSWTRPGTADKSVQRLVREKILKQRLNLGPVLREYARDGFITPQGIRNALAGVPQLQLTDEEISFCAGISDESAGKVMVRDFLWNLNVPDYDDYDPWGKSRARESTHLRNTTRSGATRQFDRHSFEVPKAQVFVPPPPKEEELEEVQGSSPGKPKRKPGAGIARKYLKMIHDEMEKKGVTLLDVFRKIDIDSSGAIDQGEFEQAIDVIGISNLDKPQMTFLFKNIDENDNGKVDIHELQTALVDSTIPDDGASSEPSRPTTFRPDSSGLKTTDPWATRTPSTRLESWLPRDHFNVRFRRSIMPPYATSETVVPIKTTFHFNPDHLRYTTVTLSNQWLTDGSGQGDIVKSRHAARIQRKRESEARMRSLVESREKAVYDMDQTRLVGISRTRANWMSTLSGPWA